MTFKQPHRMSQPKPTDYNYNATEYLYNAVDPKMRIDTIRKIVKVIRQYIKQDPDNQFDAIAVCGVSGIAMGSMVAAKLNKQLIIVRKHDDASTHSYLCVEGLLQCRTATGKRVRSNRVNRYLIVDDLIDSGATVSYMITSIAIASGGARENWGVHTALSAKCVGAILYRSIYQGHEGEHRFKRPMPLPTTSPPFNVFTANKVIDRIRVRYNLQDNDFNVSKYMPKSVDIWGKV